MKHLHLWVLVAVLCTVALGLSAYKRFALEFPISSAESAGSWKVEARIRLKAETDEAPVDPLQLLEYERFLAD